MAYGLGVQGLDRERAAHQPAAARDRAGPADPRQEAVGPGGLGPDHAGPHVPVPGRLPGAGQGHHAPVQGRPSSRPRPSSSTAPPIKTAFDTAKGAWEAKYGEGKALVGDPTDRALWPQFLKMISAYFPDPVAGLQPRPRDPADNQDDLDKLRVHIDAIKPVWRKDVAAEWFDQLDPNFKKLMHPLDVARRPPRRGLDHPDRLPPLQPLSHDKTRETWRPTDPKRTDFGPYQFITEKVLTRLNDPAMRLFGVNHVALAWMTLGPRMDHREGKQNNNLASNTVPLLDRASPPAARRGRRSGGGGMSAAAPGR